MTIVIDGRYCTSKEAAHAYLKSALSLPAHYGRNLDALYDLLTENGAALTLQIDHSAAIEAQLGDYGRALLATLRDAAAENGAFTLKLR